MKQVFESAYIAGPMRGHPYFNFDAFDAVAYQLRSEGVTVYNPADHDREVYPEMGLWPGFADGDIELCPEFSLANAMQWDMARIAESEAIVLLPGWEESSGARAERFVAESTGSTVWLANKDKLVDWDTGEPIESWYFVLDGVKRMEPPYVHRTTTVKPSIYDTPLSETMPWLTSKADEVRVVNEVTGGAKGSKLGRFDLLPPGPLLELAEHYGRGSQKYADRNWEKGYNWGLSFGALMRHAWAFWGGEDIDAETGGKHIIAVAWHALALAEFMHTHPELDTRPASQGE